VDFQLQLIELLLGDSSENGLKVSFFKATGSVWLKISGTRGSSPTNHSCCL